MAQAMMMMTSDADAKHNAAAAAATKQSLATQRVPHKKVRVFHQAPPSNSSNGSSKRNKAAAAVMSTCFNSDGAYCMAGAADGVVQLYNTASGALIKRYAEQHSHAVLTVCVAANDATFASAGADRCVYYWDVATGKVLRRMYGHTGRVNSVAMNAPDTNVLIAGSYDAAVRLWDLRSFSKQPVQTLSDAKDSITSVHYVAGSADVCAASVDGHVRTYDVRRGECHTDRIDAAAASVGSVAVSHDGKVLLASALNHSMHLLDRSDGTLLQVYRGHRNGQYPLRACFSNNDALVFSGSEDNHVYAWNVLSGKLVHVLRHHTSAVHALAFHPTKAQLLSASSDGDLVLWGI
jgi:mitogen-activated protein kinase organizer 1